ncbi:MAG: YqaJ viral recombinase family protein [Bacteroidales bacterium]|nr:YqaJ viral recombinase family protein [Bacteroidales bacterium]
MERPIKYVCRSNEEWRRERSYSIGASAVGTIIGENPWQTPLQLAERMRAELEGRFDYTQTLPMMRGHAYEQGVADLFQWQSGHEVIAASKAEYLIRRPDLPFMHASPDRTYWIDNNGKRHGKEAEKNKGILECKTTRRAIDPDNLPLCWIFQLQVQLGISGYRQGCIAWDNLTSFDGFGYRFFEYDEEIFNAAVELCRDFWQRCIKGGENPEPVNAADVVNLYPTHTVGKTIIATETLQEALDHIRSLKAAKKDVEDTLETLTSSVKVAMRDAEALVDKTGKVLATYKATAGRKSIDSKKLAIDYPETYQACIKETAGTRTLIIK